MINKNTIKNLTKHKYVNEINLFDFYKIKNNIFNSYMYILKSEHDIHIDSDSYNYFSRYTIYDDYNDSFYSKDRFINEITLFYQIKEIICWDEKEQRRKLRIIKPFVKHYKICYDIQTVIISFIS